jgi:glycosyltransferase involved in cell wall biosynthesis
VACYSPTGGKFVSAIGEGWPLKIAKDEVDEWCKFEGRWTLTNFSCKRELMALADKTIYVSKSQRDSIPLLCPNIIYGKRQNAPSGTTPKVIYNGVNTDQFEFDKGLDDLVYNLHNTKGELINIPKKGKIILYLGRIDIYKGVIYFAKAIPTIAKKFQNVTYLFVGGYSTGFDEKIRKACEYNKNVIITGRIPGDRSAAALFKRADLTVQPTLGESFNQVAMESLFMGTPVAISNIDGPQEVYVKTGFAYGLKPGDSCAIAESIISILDNLDEAKEKVRKNKKRLKETYHAEKMCSDYNTLFKSFQSARFTALSEHRRRSV